MCFEFQIIKHTLSFALIYFRHTPNLLKWYSVIIASYFYDPTSKLIHTGKAAETEKVSIQILHQQSWI